MSAATIAFLQKVWKGHLLPEDCGRKIFEYLPHPASLTLSSPSIASPPSISSFIYDPYNFPPTDSRAYVQVPRGPAAENAFDEDIFNAYATLPFGFGGDDEEAIIVREEERTEELSNKIRTSLDARLDGVCVTGSQSFIAESFFSSRCVEAETLQGLVQTEFKPYSFKGSVAFPANHKRIHQAIRQNNKSRQDDAHSKLSYELWDSACIQICNSPTDVGVSVRLDGKVVSATCVATSFCPDLQILHTLHLTDSLFVFACRTKCPMMNLPRSPAGCCSGRKVTT